VNDENGDLFAERVKSNFVLRSQIGLQLWKIWTQRWKLIVPGKRLERI
jgi:hypothetical protein